MTPSQREEIREKWLNCYYDWLDNSADERSMENVADEFWLQILDQELAKMKQEIAGLATGTNCLEKPRCCGYHDAIEDVLALLTPREETK